MDNISNRLKQIKIEDNIWIIYLGIIILSFYSNSLEEDYYLYFSSSIGLITDKNYYRNLIVPGLSIEVLRK